VLHPVGDLPASVYWRRRVVALVVLLAVLAAIGWLTLFLLDRAGSGTAPAGGTAVPGSPDPTRAPEQVVPSLAGVRTAGDRPATPPSTASAASTAPPASTAPSSAAAPGGRCSDGQVQVTVRAPAEVRAGSKPTLQIVVRNVGAAPCVRAVDQELQEIVLLDGAGRRVWGSNDCFPEQSDRSVRLAPGAEIALPIVWSGRTSAPDCAGERLVPPAGDYALRARLDTKTSPNRPLELT
jgi:hypothetical protein